MAGGGKAFYTGTSNILGAFDDLGNDNPYFSLWRGRDILFSYSIDDVPGARSKLESILEAAEDQENTDLLTLKFHPAPGKEDYITNKSKVLNAIPIRAYDYQSKDDGIVSGMGGEMRFASPLYHSLKRIEDSVVTNNTALEARLKALEDGKIETPEPDMLDRIGAIIEKPGVMDLFKQVLGAILTPPQPNLQIAGMNDNETKAPVPVPDEVNNNQPAAAQNETFEFSEQDDAIIDDCIFRLSKYCNVIEALQLLTVYAEQNPDTFGLVLNSLKTK